MLTILVSLLRLILGLRYKIHVKGLDAIKNNDSRGIIFLPNHPALLDPPIVFSSLYSRFKIRPLADENQVSGLVIRAFMKKIRCVTIPDMTLNGRNSKDSVVRAMSEVINGLKQGDQFLFYPSGRIYRTQFESLRGNSGVAQIRKEVPNVRVILVRTTGMWGSSFSRAIGSKPSLYKDLGMKILAVLSGAIFFMPKRHVTIEFNEVDDLPNGDYRLALNRYLERFYNKTAPANRYVPYCWWHGVEAQSRPEPLVQVSSSAVAGISLETKKQILAKITDLSGNNAFQETDTLASDVGMDSLAVAELTVWVEQEFGHVIDDIEALVTVNDVFLAAAGQLVSTKSERTISAPKRWHCPEDSPYLRCSEEDSITGIFLDQALQKPSLPVMADLIGGVKTYRDIVTGIFALVPVFKKMKETNIGLMLPAGVTCTIAYYSLLFAGKTPVMVNWTMGESNLNYCLAKVGVTQVITAKALLMKLSSQGFETESNPFSWVCLEDIGRDLSFVTKIFSRLKSYTSLASLHRAKVQEIAAILFTSGSEARPKAVPLTHRNLIANVADVNTILGVRQDDVLVGMLPPFHSLGLTGTVILPMSLGLQVVYHANPTEAAVLVEIIQEYRVTVLIGTPTFLHGILRGAQANQLSSLRLSFTGAEKCPSYVYETMAEQYPNTIVCEGYGVTECAPLVSVNHPENPVVGSIGKVLGSMEYVLVDPEEKNIEVDTGRKGMLLVRGANVFSGYLHHEGEQPFIEFDDKQWYETGDLIREDENNVLYFAGRLKRFIKIGGEMISLPAIESVLIEELRLPEQDGVVLAVETMGDDETPALVLFIVIDMDRHTVNKAIRAGGLSPLHNIRKVIVVSEIPILGTGKTDYQSLKKMIMQ